MASNLRVDTILPSTGTSLGIGTASGTTTITGNLVASSVSFTGSLGIGGTLTYEDVTNVDSVGIITARSGIRVTSGTVSVGNNASPDGKLHVYSSSAGTVTADADADELVLESSGNTGLSILSPGTGESSIYFGNPGTNGQKDGWIKFYHETHSTTANRRALTFRNSGTERLRIDGDGDLLLGSTSFSGFGAADRRFLINGTSNARFELGVGGNQIGGLYADTNQVVLYTSGNDYLSLQTTGTERVRIQDGGLRMPGGSYIMDISAGHGAPNNNNKQMDQRRWMWYGTSSSTHTVARVAKASSGSAGDGDSQLAAWIVTYTARSMYGFNSDGGYSVMKMRTGRFDYNDNEVRFSTEQDTLGTGGGSQNPTIVFTDEGSGVVRISITNPSSTHSFGEINLMTYDCRITLPTG